IWHHFARCSGRFGTAVEYGRRNPCLWCGIFGDDQCGWWFCSHRSHARDVSRQEEEGEIVMMALEKFTFEMIFLLAASGFVACLKLLASPKTARLGNLIGA